MSSSLLTVLLLALVGTRLDITSLGLPVGMIVILVGLHLVYTKVRPDPLIGPLAGGLAVVAWGGVAGGLTALAGLRANRPLIDADLAAADHVLALDVPRFVAWVAHHPAVMWLLDGAYLSTVPLIFAGVVFLALTRRERSVWELCFTFAALVNLFGLISSVIPAAGAFAYHHVPNEVLSRLPAGAGLYYIPVFEAYRSGVLAIVDARRIDGVVTFPSFHTAMALMTAYAMRGSRLQSAAWIWAALMIVSTVPMGGHYVVDSVASAMVWAAFTLFARALSRPRRRRRLRVSTPVGGLQGGVDAPA